MQIQILGPGCANCVTLERRVQESLARLGIADAAVGKVTDYGEIAAYGVMKTPGLVIDVERLSASLAATNGAVLAERATFLLAETMGKEKAGKIVEEALSKGGSFVAALGQLERELADEKAMLGMSPKFVDRLLAGIRRTLPSS